MGRPIKISAVLVAVAVVVVAVATMGTLGQSTSCAEKLIPCGDYLNSTDPPPGTCCDPLRDAVTNNLACLCNLYNTPGLVASLHLNVTQAILLIGRCNIPTAGLSSCVNALAPAGSPPSATPGNDNNGASRIAWTGMSTALLIWTSMMVY